MTKRADREAPSASVAPVRRSLLALATAALVTLGGAAGASAQEGVGSVGLNPNKVSAASNAQIAIAGVTGFSTLPTGVELLLQPGFTSSIKAVTALCSGMAATTGNCAPASQIGTGVVQVSFFGSGTAVQVALYLGPPLQSGDISSVVVVGNFQGTALNITGRIFTPPGGGLEVLLPSFPSLPVTLTSFAVSLSASQTQIKHLTKRITKTHTKFVYRGKGKKRHRVKVKYKTHKTIHYTVRVVYSVVTNPSTCSGTWTGTAILTFASGVDSLPLSTACTS